MVDAALGVVGRIDILVNNAGWRPRPAGHHYDDFHEQLTSKEWLRVLAVNTVGPMVCAMACRSAMAAQGGGAIVNQSSNAAYTGAAGAYGVSKAGVNASTMWLAEELAPDGIRVNAIAGVTTGRIDPAQLETIVSRQVIARRASPRTWSAPWCSWPQLLVVHHRPDDPRRRRPDPALPTGLPATRRGGRHLPGDSPEVNRQAMTPSGPWSASSVAGADPEDEPAGDGAERTEVGIEGVAGVDPETNRQEMAPSGLKSASKVSPRRHPRRRTGRRWRRAGRSRHQGCRRRGPRD